MIWVDISWYSADALIHITGQITGNGYLNILNDEVLALNST